MSVRPNFAHLERASSGQPIYIALPANQVCWLGRGTENTVIVNDQLVSRNHALIDCRNEGEYFLTDLGSRNGTLLNGARILAPTRLFDGDQITVGEETFTFRNAVRLPEAGYSQESRGGGETIVMVSLEVITVLVVDIRNYSHWSRVLGTEKMAAVISTLFQQADVVLRRSNVWGQKYIGDAIMGIWKHSRSGSNEALLRSVLESTVELFRIVSGLQAQFGFEMPLEIGGGINTGPASLGNMGGDGSADYTALGDAVNKAFRLEAATRTVNCDILLGDSTFEWLSPDLRTASFKRQTVTLKGYPEPQPALEISVQELEELLLRTRPAAT